MCAVGVPLASRTACSIQFCCEIRRRPPRLSGSLSRSSRVHAAIWRKVVTPAWLSTAASASVTPSIKRRLSFPEGAGLFAGAAGRAALPPTVAAVAAAAAAAAAATASPGPVGLSFPAGTGRSAALSEAGSEVDRSAGVRGETLAWPLTPEADTFPPPVASFGASGLGGGSVPGLVASGRSLSSLRRSAGSLAAPASG